jgi:formamidopyrimidine-DNA glycosylase
VRPSTGIIRPSLRGFHVILFHSDKRNDHTKLAKLAVSFRQLKADSSASEASHSTEIEALQAKILLLDSEIVASSQFL